ncbi:glycosyltransferase family 2 protein [Grimontia hollisae]|uniref:Glycosyltransferase involved in cell wall biogenesis n=1 Tax=Grimontia hollisae CIP 101886 TaxID=675812 RepID=D0IBZ9_GRIHO|nr:glycosyltransferase family 2 protein [Grimontia hollisae]AMG29787.1 glycosyltransferase family 2 protein [Grimontia hollisae]EEY71417.1 glycosyltransferase involved in cell wall biogenesis [Grimontia hollisae CIP 101886]STO43358.1 transferase 2, rSAM/selenodomain-associated [Grimontia hollisae]
MTVSVLILTLNEELNIKKCLDSLSWCDDVVVLDSYSSDNTEFIASQYTNVRVIKNKFKGYASQRNFGLKEIDYKYNWLLMLDADELIDDTLLSEIKKVTSVPSSDISLYRFRRKDFFFGGWIKRSSGYPTWFGRLMKISDVSIKREINEEYITEGGIGYLNGHLLHYPFSKGMEWWFEKHNRYSSMESIQKNDDNDEVLEFNTLSIKDAVNRRRLIKRILYRLPFRPLVVFCLLYFFRFGFLDGKAGFRFCLLRSIYEYMIDIKFLEYKYTRKKNEEK